MQVMKGCFIVEQAGVIKIIDEQGTVLSTPFLDIRNIVDDASSETGLAGIGFFIRIMPTTDIFFVQLY